MFNILQTLKVVACKASYVVTHWQWNKKTRQRQFKEEREVLEGRGICVRVCSTAVLGGGGGEQLFDGVGLLSTDLIFHWPNINLLG